MRRRFRKTRIAGFDLHEATVLRIERLQVGVLDVVDPTVVAQLAAC